MSGYLEDLSPQQREALDVFRARVGELIDNDTVLHSQKEITTDYILLKFLRARNFKLEDSYKMIANTLKFRATFVPGGIQNIKEEDVQNVLKHDLAHYRHTDRKGNPIYWVRIKQHDKNDRDLEEMKKFVIHQMELGRKLMTYPAETSTIVFDLSNVGMKSLDLPVGKFIIDMLQNHYPESLAKAILYNAPFVFSSFWVLLKPFMDPNTVQKVCFVKHTKEIEQYIDLAYIPTSLGGQDSQPYHYTPGSQSPPATTSL